MSRKSLKGQLRRALSPHPKNRNHPPSKTGGSTGSPRTRDEIPACAEMTDARWRAWPSLPCGHLPLRGRQGRDSCLRRNDGARLRRVNPLTQPSPDFGGGDRRAPTRDAPTGGGPVPPSPQVWGGSPRQRRGGVCTRRRARTATVTFARCAVGADSLTLFPNNSATAGTPAPRDPAPPKEKCSTMLQIATPAEKPAFSPRQAAARSTSKWPQMALNGTLSRKTAMRPSPRPPPSSGEGVGWASDPPPAPSGLPPHTCGGQGRDSCLRRNDGCALARAALSALRASPPQGENSDTLPRGRRPEWASDPPPLRGCPPHLWGAGEIPAFAGMTEARYGSRRRQAMRAAQTTPARLMRPLIVPAAEPAESPHGRRGERHREQGDVLVKAASPPVDRRADSLAHQVAEAHHERDVEEPGAREEAP